MLKVRENSVSESYIQKQRAKAAVKWRRQRIPFVASQEDTAVLYAFIGVACDDGREHLDARWLIENLRTQ